MKQVPRKKKARRTHIHKPVQVRATYDPTTGACKSVERDSRTALIVEKIGDALRSTQRKLLRDGTIKENNLAEQLLVELQYQTSPPALAAFQNEFYALLPRALIGEPRPSVDRGPYSLAVYLHRLHGQRKSSTIEPLEQESCPSPLETDSHAAKTLEQIDIEYAILRDDARRAIMKLLAAKAGVDFDSFEARKLFVANIRKRLQIFDLRIKCPNPDCHLPAMLKTGRFGNSKEGVFQFVHTSGAAHGGSATLPSNLEVVDAPPDRRVKHSAAADPVKSASASN